jgi:WD40 repeat protein
MEGHTDVASAAVFKLQDATVAYSSSWDHTVRTWDLTMSKQVDSKSTMHPLLCLTEMRGVSLLAAGSSARHITLIDPRASASKISAMTLRGHINAVVSLAQDPASDYSLVSGSHDGSCRVWDIRSVRPSSDGQQEGQIGESLYVFYRESIGEGKKAPEGGRGVKVFDVRWDKDLGIVSASEDKSVQINRPGMTQNPL